MSSNDGILQSRPLKNTQAGRWLWWIFAACACHRIVQWLILQEQVMYVAVLNSEVLVMQLLPAELWREHFWASLLYLQQTPPLPNLIYGIAVLCFDNTQTLTAFLVLFCGFLSSVAATMLALLLSRMGIPRSICCITALVFAGSTDVLMVEYFAFGQIFYEQLTMVAALCAALSAQKLVQHRDFRASIALGFAIAVLALTRASFSYFAFPTLIWLLWIFHRRTDFRVIVGFLLPVLLLHGGWALKQKVIQDQWLWATSSWGGLNIFMGDMRRSAALIQAGKIKPEEAKFDIASISVDAPCLLNWQHLLSSSPLIFFLGASFDSWIPGPGEGPSSGALKVDAAATKARERRIPRDTAALRELSQCLQQAKLTSWVHQPVSMIRDGWQSYGVFWSPLAGMAETVPTVLIPVKPIWRDPADVPLWRPQGNLLSWPSYMIRQQRYRRFFSYQACLRSSPWLPYI